MSNNKKTYLAIWDAILRFTTLIFISIIVILFIRILSLTIFIYDVKQEVSLKLNEFGDYVGGVWGTGISLLALIATVIGSVFIYKTFQIQRRQIEIQQEQIENQNQSEYLQKTIEIIYHQLERIKEEINSLKLSQNNITGYDYLKYFNSLRRNKVKGFLLQDYKDKWEFRALVFYSFSIFASIIERKNGERFILNDDEKKICSTIICTNLHMVIIKNYLERCGKLLSSHNKRSSTLSLDEEKAFYKHSIPRIKSMMQNTVVVYPNSPHTFS
jgi:cell division protein FtsL